MAANQISEEPKQAQTVSDEAAAAAGLDFSAPKAEEEELAPLDKKLLAKTPTEEQVAAAEAIANNAQVNEEVKNAGLVPLTQNVAQETDTGNTDIQAALSGAQTAQQTQTPPAQPAATNSNTASSTQQLQNTSGTNLTVSNTTDNSVTYTFKGDFNQARAAANNMIASGDANTQANAKITSTTRNQDGSYNVTVTVKPPLTVANTSTSSPSTPVAAANTTNNNSPAPKPSTNLSDYSATQTATYSQKITVNNNEVYATKEQAAAWDKYYNTN